MIPSPTIRHLATEGVQRYIDQNIVATLRVDGDPPAFLSIDPIQRRLAIQIAGQHTLPDCSRYANVRVARVRRDKSDWSELSIAAAARLTDLYPLFCQILDQIQLEGLSLDAATTAVFASYRAALQMRSVISEQDQLGLYGELLILEQLILSAGSQDAVHAWVGSEQEEHDFAIASGDIEVKTTSGEFRRHWISSPSQLVPTMNTPLFLVSVQLTRSGTSGRTLSEMITNIEVMLSGEAAILQEIVNEKLDTRGYRQTDANLYSAAWTLRSAPAAYAVDSNFPAVAPKALAQVVVDPQRIVDFRYQIDLLGLPTTKLPELPGVTI